MSPRSSVARFDGRTTRHPGYAVSQRVRKRVEDLRHQTVAGGFASVQPPVAQRGSWGQQLAYQDRGRERHTIGHWRRNGAVVLIEINDCYAKYEGSIAGSEIKGEYSNEPGARTPWTAHRPH
jgi:hypothetical protein